MLGYVSGVCVLVSLGLRYKALLSPQQQHRVVVVASTSTSPLPSLKRSPRKGHIYSHIASVSINGGAATTRGTRSTPLSRLISELSSLPPVNSRWPFTQYSRLCHRHRRSFLQTSSSNSTHFPLIPLNPPKTHNPNMTFTLCSNLDRHISFSSLLQPIKQKSSPASTLIYGLYLIFPHIIKCHKLTANTVPTSFKE